MTKLPPELEKLRDDGAYNFPRSGCEGAFSDGFDICYEAMQSLPVNGQAEHKSTPTDMERADAWVTRTGNIGTTARQMFIDGMLEERAKYAKLMSALAWFDDEFIKVMIPGPDWFPSARAVADAYNELEEQE